MDDNLNRQLLAQSGQMHSQVEQQYLNHPATAKDGDWLAKQRWLLADMALHLLQTALASSEPSQAQLARNLYAILTVSKPMLPNVDFNDCIAALLQHQYSSPEVESNDRAKSEPL